MVLPVQNDRGFRVELFDAANLVAFQAPAAFLGDKSAAYGGVLHGEERLLASDGASYPVAALGNDQLFLQFRMPPPGTDWTIFDLPLVASAGWEIVRVAPVWAPAQTAPLSTITMASAKRRVRMSPPVGPEDTISHADPANPGGRRPAG